MKSHGGDPENNYNIDLEGDVRKKIDFDEEQMVDDEDIVQSQEEG